MANLERTDEHNKNYANSDNDPNGLWRAGDVRNALYRPNLIYEIETPSGKKIAPPPNGWRWSKETVRQKISTGEIKFSTDETRIIRKIYLKNVEGRTPETIWFGKEAGTTRDAATELKELFDGNAPFDTPKPTQLVDQMLQLSTTAKDEEIVLDFFGGSGTTAHAVLSANKSDGGNRTFIIVQLPEPTERKDFSTIADITKERVRRVIKKLNDEDAADLNRKERKEHREEPELEFSAPQSSLSSLRSLRLNPDRGFKVFKLQSSNFKTWNADVPKESEALAKQLEMHVHHIIAGRTPEDLLFEILLKSGLFQWHPDLREIELAGKRVFELGDGLMLICLEKQLTPEVIKEMAARKPERVVCLDEGFAGNDQLKTNAVQTMKTKGVTSFRTV